MDVVDVAAAGALCWLLPADVDVGVDLVAVFADRAGSVTVRATVTVRALAPQPASRTAATSAGASLWVTGWRCWSVRLSAGCVERRSTDSAWRSASCVNRLMRPGGAGGLRSRAAVAIRVW